MILLGTEVAGPAAYISSINFGKIKTKWVYSNRLKSFYIQKNMHPIHYYLKVERHQKKVPKQL